MPTPTPGRISPRPGLCPYIIGTLEASDAFGLPVHPLGRIDVRLVMVIDFDPCRQADLGLLVGLWLPLTGAIDRLNHGVRLCAFICALTLKGNLRFAHDLILR